MSSSRRGATELLSFSVRGYGKKTVFHLHYCRQKAKKNALYKYRWQKIFGSSCSTLKPLYLFNKLQ